MDLTFIHFCALALFMFILHSACLLEMGMEYIVGVHTPTVSYGYFSKIHCPYVVGVPSPILLKSLIGVSK